MDELDMMLEELEKSINELGDEMRTASQTCENDNDEIDVILNMRKSHVDTLFSTVFDRLGDLYEDCDRNRRNIENLRYPSKT